MKGMINGLPASNVVLFLAAIFLNSINVWQSEANVNSCPDPDPTWSRGELDVLQSICSGAIKGAAYKLHSEDAMQEISAQFLQDLILDPKYEPVMHLHGLVLSNVTVKGKVNLQGLVFNRPITISNSNFSDEIDLSGA